MRALVIEDEKRLAQNVARTLRERSTCAVDIAHDGTEGLFMAESSPYDLLILDLMLPTLSGLEILKRYRVHSAKTPVLILTARDDKESVIVLLNAGADDYISKPFDMGEFIARCKALIRRGKGEHSNTLRIGDLEVNIDSGLVCRNGRLIVLTNMEYRVLEYLAHRQGAFVSKTELSEHLYDYNWEKFSNVIEVYISTLRRKIDRAEPIKLIHTSRGKGYSLRVGEAPHQSEEDDEDDLAGKAPHWRGRVVAAFIGSSTRHAR
jgi:two-component system response regulator PhoP